MIYPDSDNELAPEVPPWLSTFVRVEVLPLLQQHRAEALAGWAHWFARGTARRQHTSQRLVKLQAYLTQNPRPDDPPPQFAPRGMSWCEEMAGTNGGLERVQRYVPSELTTDLPCDFPFPLPENRTLQPDEAWVVLLSIYDVVRDSRERIVPDTNGVDDGIRLLLHERVLVDAAPGGRGLTEAHLPLLRDTVRIASESVTPSAASTVPPVDHAQGQLRSHEPIVHMNSVAYNIQIVMPQPLEQQDQPNAGLPLSVGTATQTQALDSIQPLPKREQDEPPGNSNREHRRMAAIAWDEMSARIMAIAGDETKSADQRQREISALDNRAIGWDGERWAEVLNVTDRAARKTSWWKVDRKRLQSRE